MATIIIGHRLFAENEEDAKSKGVKPLEDLWDKIENQLEYVEKDCLEKFPDLVVEINDLDIKYVSVDEMDEEDGKIIWELSYWIEVNTTSPDGKPECDYSFNEYDQWHLAGEPMYKEICEPLYNCDWSKIVPFCGGTGETMGDVVSVQFDAIKAVESYHGGIHFFNNRRYL